MSTFKALLKQLLGAKYDRARKSLAVCLILYLSIHGTGMEINIAPPILFLTAAVCSAGLMRQALNSPSSRDILAGFLLLPFADGNMLCSILAAFTGYTLITGTFPVLALFFAVHAWSPLQIFLTLLCACGGCLLATIWQAVAGRQEEAGRTAGDGGQNTAVKQAAAGKKAPLPPLNVYIFCHPTPVKRPVGHARRTGSIFLYLLRYLAANKNYLLNTLGLCLAAVILPLLLGQFSGLNLMPFGFAILCLNTPLCVLLSSDPHLEQAVRMLPNQTVRFCAVYCLFLFAVNMAINSIYLISWQLHYENTGFTEITDALLICLSSAVLSVLLEWFWPLRGWKLESDLWRHPRKYIVPLIMMLLAAMMGMLRLRSLAISDLL